METTTPDEPLGYNSSHDLLTALHRLDMQNKALLKTTMPVVNDIAHTINQQYPAEATSRLIDLATHALQVVRMISFEAQLLRSQVLGLRPSNHQAD